MPGFVSNSELGDLKKALYGIEDMPNLQAVYDMGNLVDGMKTEPENVDFTNRTLFQNDRLITFSEPDFSLAHEMKLALDADPLLTSMLNSSGVLYQHVIIRNAVPITYDGDTVLLPMKMKADVFKRGHWLIDIKTTACDTQQQFNDSIKFFDYDRQGTHYLDMGRVPKILFCGVSKKKNRRTGKRPVFHYLMEHGDETYKSGLNKKNYWGYKYYHLIHTTNLFAK